MKTSPSPKDDQKQNPPLQVTMRSREKVLYKGVATTVSSENERGPFDILVSHANFISLIHNYVIIDHGLPTEQSFQIDKGIMYVASNKIDIYVGI
jgi:F0F1-type ATP synthase epsilon subunit